MPARAPSSTSACGWLIGALGVGILAAVLSTFPLVTRLWNFIPDCPAGRGATCRDSVLTAWIVGEAARRLTTNPRELFEASILFPLRHTLAYSESMLSAGALVAPLRWLVGNPVAEYNVYYLTTYVLAALGMFLLVREVTGDPRAAILAGWLFALADERWWFRGRLAAFSGHWIPFVLWAWIRMLRRPTPGRALALGAVLAANTHAGAYYALALPLLLGPWALVLLLRGPWPLRRWILIGGVAACTLAASFVPFLAYLTVQSEIHYAPQRFGTGPITNLLWNALVSLPDEILHPFAGRRRSAALSLLPILALGVMVVLGRRRPVTPAPPTESAHLLALIVFWLAALVLASDPIVPGIRGPFALFDDLPGLSAMRSPGRFYVVATCGGAAVMGIALARVFRLTRSRVASVLALALAALIVLDTRTLREPMPLRRLPAPGDVPPVYHWLATTDADAAILEIPRGSDEDLTYMIHALYHGRRIANGHSAIRPDLYRFTWPFSSSYNITMLQQAGIRYLLIHTDRPGGPAFATVFGGRPDLIRRRIGDTVVVEIPPREAGPSNPPPPELTSPIRLRGSSAGAERAADGDLDTHWTPPPGRHDSFLHIDLGTVRFIWGIGVRLGAHFLEFPRRYSVWALTDRQQWELVGEEEDVIPPFQAYHADHRDVEIPLVMRPVETRYLEIRVPATPSPEDLPFSDPSPNWGVHELRIWGRKRDYRRYGEESSPRRDTPPGRDVGPPPAPGER